jgi:hypothetical protein
MELTLFVLVKYDTDCDCDVNRSMDVKTSFDIKDLINYVCDDLDLDPDYEDDQIICEEISTSLEDNGCFVSEGTDTWYVVKKQALTLNLGNKDDE